MCFSSTLFEQGVGHESNTKVRERFIQILKLSLKPAFHSGVFQLLRKVLVQTLQRRDAFITEGHTHNPRKAQEYGRHHYTTQSSYPACGQSPCSVTLPFSLSLISIKSLIQMSLLSTCSISSPPVPQDQQNLMVSLFGLFFTPPAQNLTLHHGLLRSQFCLFVFTQPAH